MLNNDFFCDKSIQLEDLYATPKMYLGFRIYYNFIEFNKPIDSSNMTP